MNDLDDIKEEITKLVFSGKKEEAISLLQNKYGINREEAITLLAIAIRESADPGTFSKRIPILLAEFLKGQKGCKKSIYSALSFCFGFFGIPMLLAAVGLGIYFNYEEKQGVSITGTVVDFDSYFYEDGQEQHTPIVSYFIERQEYSCKGTMYSNPPDYVLGASIPLIVSTDDPESVYINTFYERWFVVVTLGSIGIGFIFLMIVFRILSS